MTKYLAFNNDAALQARMLAAVDLHVKQDQVIQQTYSNSDTGVFRGCFIGCTINAFDGGMSSSYEEASLVTAAYGFPLILTRICEQVFEGLPAEDAPAFFRDVPNTLHLGADLSLVAWKFLHWIVQDVMEKHGTDYVRESHADVVAILLDKANGVDVTAPCNSSAIFPPAGSLPSDAAFAAIYACHAAYDGSVANDVIAANAASATGHAAAGDKSSYQRFAAKLIELLNGAEP